MSLYMWAVTEQGRLAPLLLVVTQARFESRWPSGAYTWREAHEFLEFRRKTTRGGAAVSRQPVDDNRKQLVRERAMKIYGGFNRKEDFGPPDEYLVSPT